MNAKSGAFYMETHVAGLMYWDALMIWDQLKVGTRLTMVREASNPVDHQAIALYYKNVNQGVAYQIGYIPRGDNEDLAKFFDMGYGDIFDVTISRLCPEAHYENQVHIIIRIKPRKTTLYIINHLTN